MERSTYELEVEALARRAVETTRPDELPLFSTTATAYFADPRRAVAVAKQGARDDMLGFGLEAAEMIPAVTTAALWIAQEIVTTLGTQVRAAVEEESDGLVRKWLRRLLVALRIVEPEPEPAAPSARIIEQLTPEQLGRIRAIAHAKARELLPERDATAIADALVAGLVLPASSQARPPSAAVESD